MIGSLEQQWSICQPRFLVKDEHGEAILSIQGPGGCGVCDTCSDIDFNIRSLRNESEVWGVNMVIVMTSLNSPSLDWKNYQKMVRYRTGIVHGRTKLWSDFPNRSWCEDEGHIARRNISDWLHVLWKTKQWIKRIRRRKILWTFHTLHVSNFDVNPLLHKMT